MIRAASTLSATFLVLAVSVPAAAETCRWAGPSWKWLLTSKSARPAYVTWHLAGGFTDVALADQVRRAAKTWNATGSSRVQFRQGAPRDKVENGNGLSEVALHNGPYCKLYSAPCTGSVGAFTKLQVVGDKIKEFDILFFGQNSDGTPIKWTPQIMLATAVREFGRALGLEAPQQDAGSTVMGAGAALWPMLSWHDVNCLREGAQGQGGYGHLERLIGSAFSMNAGLSWNFAAHQYPEFREATVPPAVAGNEETMDSRQAYLAAWPDAKYRIRTMLGEGLSFDIRTQRIHNDYSYFPMDAVFGAGRWMIAWVGIDNQLHTKWSADIEGRQWTKAISIDPKIGAQPKFFGAPAIAYNDLTHRFVLAALHDDGKGFRDVVFFTSEDGRKWQRQAAAEPWLRNRAWSIDIACGETANNLCVLAYSDYARPLKLRWRRFFVFEDGMLLSQSEGPISRFDEANESFFAPTVAYNRNDNTPGEKASVFAWSSASRFPAIRTIRRSRETYEFHYDQALLANCAGGDCPVIGRIVVVSGDFWNEHLLFYAYDP